MSSRKETDRAKHIQEKCNLLLAEMLRDEDNKYCVDCDAKGPRWASWNLGIFLCIRCAGIHRNLGVHISKVKSVNLDSWTPVQVVSLQQMGNSRARAVYESYLPDGFRRPQTDSALESFIRAKYEHKKYLAREWVQPPLPKVDWDKEIDEELERQKKKKKSGAAVTTSIGSLTSQVSALTKTPPAAAKTIASLPAPIAKPKPSGSPKAARTENLDLLGLASPTKSANDDLDVFSGFLSAAPAAAPAQPSVTTLQPLAKAVITEKEPSVPTSAPTAANFSSLAQEVDFFNHVPNGNKASGAAASGKLTKDSIMALYGQAPLTGAGPASLGSYGNQPTQPHQPSQFGQQPASLPQQNLYQFGAAPQHQMFGVPTQQPPQQQQNGLLFQLGGATNSNMMPPHPYNQQFGQFTGAQMLPQMPPQHTANQTSTINLINKINTMPSAGTDLSKHFGNINLGNVWP